MVLNKETRVLIVGLGVIGGGYAAGLTKAGYTVSCITKNQADIDYALKRGMIKYGTTELDREIVERLLEYLGGGGGAVLEDFTEEIV